MVVKVHDVLTGGDGADTFYVDKIDTITDFDMSQGRRRIVSLKICIA